MATRQLRDALEASSAALATGQGPEAQALEGFIRSHGELVTEAFSNQIRTVVGSEQIVVSARLLMGTLSRPYPVDVAIAGQRGRWIPLPAGSPPAQTLLSTTAAAQRASSEMVAMTRARSTHPHNDLGKKVTPEVSMDGLRRAKDALDRLRATQDSAPARNHHRDERGSSPGHSSPRLH